MPARRIDSRQHSASPSNRTRRPSTRFGRWCHPGPPLGWPETRIGPRSHDRKLYIESYVRQVGSLPSGFHWKARQIIRHDTNTVFPLPARKPDVSNVEKTMRHDTKDVQYNEGGASLLRYHVISGLEQWRRVNVKYIDDARYACSRG